MAMMNRRFFLLATAAAAGGCAVRRRASAPQAMATAQPVRPPAAGQSWHYAKHDFFSRNVLDSQLDRVADVGRTISIDSHLEGKASSAEGKSSWGVSWLRQYVDHAKPDSLLPSEVQAPWGMVVVDPHWNQVQVYETPIPLWPLQLVPGWHTNVRVRYRTVDSASPLAWQQTMKAEAWETVAVPAGKFKALRYTNLIKFSSSDPTRADSMRHETIWFAPEVGRWLARESTGSYYIDDSAADQPYTESSYRWELLEWT